MILPVINRGRPCIVAILSQFKGSAVIPDYLTFIRFQDKRLLPFLYLIAFILLGFYWKNNDYVIQHNDAWFVSGILALMVYNVVNELKAFWAYKCAIGNVDLSFFRGRGLSKVEKRLSQPLLIAILSGLVFWALIQGCLLLPSPVYQTGSLLIISPLIVYLLFRFARHACIKEIGAEAIDKVKYRHLRGYVYIHVIFTLILNVLTIVPLKNNADFSFSEGFLSARLIVATLMMCAIVLALNLAFARMNKCYVFLGRLFIKEIDFYFSRSVPCPSLLNKPFWLRMLWLLVIQLLWIATLALALTLSGWHIWFAAWFLLSFLPSAAYYYLHVYWRWHHDFMMSCDMCFRWREIEKQSDLW
jgi:hypothetical protein